MNTITWVVMFVYRGLSRLPLAWLRRLGSGLGWLLARTLHSRRHVAIRNLEACFPDLDEADRQQLLARHFRHLGQGILDISYSSWVSQARIHRNVEIRGMNELIDKLRSGKGVILLAPHFVDAQVGALCLSHYFPLMAMYKRQRSRIFDSVYRKVCMPDSPSSHLLEKWIAPKNGRNSIQLVEHRESFRKVVRHLREGGIFFYLPDQDLGRRHAIFAPFFNIAAITVTAVSRFAGLGKAHIILCSTTQSTGTKKILIDLKTLQRFPKKSELSVAKRVNKEVEQMVREVPEQYFWLHKRFKTRPEGEPPFYR